LTCPVFVTTVEFLPQHHRQLDSTRALIAQAEQEGHQRMTEMNRTVERNLQSIIASLSCDDTNTEPLDEGPNEVAESPRTGPDAA
jgi:hypothetical protein